MLNIINDQLKKQLHIIKLSRCILCNAPHNNTHKLLCHPCDTSLPYIAHHCHQCGNFLPTNTPYLCRYCLKKTAIFDGALSVFHYQPPIDYFIKQLKFHQQLFYADILGNKMANALIKHAEQTKAALTTPDAILPIPLHPKRIRQRGFNQALEIAKPIAKKLNIPLVTHTLIRSRYTQAQTELKAMERKKNLHNSFLYQPDTHYKNIAIIDDVMTTGTTLYEVTKTLKQHVQVENVYAWICACSEDVY